MSGVAHIQCHFVRNRINHRLRFGVPQERIKLDKFRQLAVIGTGQTVGYIRWQANEFGTQDWRFYVFSTASMGNLTRIPGVYPAVQCHYFVNGPVAIRRALRAIDKLELVLNTPLDALPKSYWLTFSDRIQNQSTTPLLPKRYMTEAHSDVL